MDLNSLTPKNQPPAESGLPTVIRKKQALQSDLIKVLETSKEPLPRALALIGCAEIGGSALNARAIKTIVENLPTLDTPSRIFAVKALAGSTDGLAITALSKTEQFSNRDFKSRIRIMLLSKASLEYADAWETHCGKDHALTKEIRIIALGNESSLEAAQKLKEYAHDSDPAIQVLALSSIDATRHASLLPWIREKLKDSEPSMQRTAMLSALDPQHNAEDLTLICSIAKDAHASTSERTVAFSALRGVTSKETAKTILEVLNQRGDSSQATTLESAVLAAAQGTADVDLRKKLIELTNINSYYIREAVVEGLGTPRSDEEVNDLRTIFDLALKNRIKIGGDTLSSDYDDLVRATQLLCSSELTSARQLVREITSSSNLWIREAAITGCGRWLSSVQGGDDKEIWQIVENTLLDSTIEPFISPFEMHPAELPLDHIADPRAAAARIYASLPPNKKIIEMLLDYQNKASPKGQAEIAHSLRNSKSDIHCFTLATMLEAENEAVQIATLKSIQKLPVLHDDMRGMIADHIYDNIREDGLAGILRPHFIAAYAALHGEVDFEQEFLRDNSGLKPGMTVSYYVSDAANFYLDSLREYFSALRKVYEQAQIPKSSAERERDRYEIEQGLVTEKLCLDGTGHSLPLIYGIGQNLFNFERRSQAQLKMICAALIESSTLSTSRSEEDEIFSEEAFPDLNLDRPHNPDFDPDFDPTA